MKVLLTLVVLAFIHLGTPSTWARPIDGQVALQTPQGPLPATSGVVYLVPDTQANWTQLNGLALRIGRFRTLVRQSSLRAQNDPTSLRDYNAALLQLKGLLNRMMSTARTKAEQTSIIENGTFTLPDTETPYILVVSAQALLNQPTATTLAGWWMARDTADLNPDGQLYQIGIPLADQPDAKNP